MNYFFLSNTPLFHGITEREIEQLLTCLHAREQEYRKDETILRAGNTVHEIGLVLTGSVNIVVNFYWGSSQIFGHVEKGRIFAENYAALPGKELICDVVAADDCRILFLDLARLLTTCQKGCPSHQRLIHNLLGISAQKSLNLSSRMLHTAPRTLRGKLLSYLSEQSMVQKNSHFTIPFNRQQLADYLGVDRSAMSNELGKMQRDGLILCRKNEFTLCDRTAS